MIFKKPINTFFILVLCIFISSVWSLHTKTHNIKTSILQNTNPVFNLNTINKNTQNKHKTTSTIKISTIKIISANKKLNSDITKKLRQYKTEPFSKDLSNKIYNTILVSLKKEKFLQPQIRGPVFTLNNNTLSIAYTISNPYKYGFIFKNNKKISKYELLRKSYYRKYFNSTQLIRKILSNLTEAYLKKGYTKVKLTYKVMYDHKHLIKTFVISINEGQKTTIKAIKLYGQFSKKSQYYMQFIYNNSSSVIKKKIFYNPHLQRGVQNLINSLKNTGYLEAKANASVTHTPDNTVQITVHLTEGTLTKITKIHFTGNTYFSTDKLKNLLKIKINDGLNLYNVERDSQNLIMLYKNAGFMEVKLKDIVRYNKKQSLATVRFEIEEKAQSKIADIKIAINIITKKEKNSSTKKEKNIITNKKLILRNLPIKVGDILTFKKKYLAKQKISNLGVFSSVNIDTIPYNNNPKQKTLRITVTEKTAKSIRATLGVHTERTLTARGLIEFSHNNIMGLGRWFFSQVKFQSNIAHYIRKKSSEPNYLEHQALVSYREPILLDSTFNGKIYFSNSSKIFSYKKINTSYIMNIINSAKIDLLLTKVIHNFIKIKWTILSWESRRDFNTGCTNNFITPNNTLCPKGNTLNISTLGLSVIIDKRDNILSTSNGFLSKMFLEYSGPVSIIPTSDAIHFIKMEFKHFYFYPIIDNGILVNSLQGGFITTINKKGFPVHRAFILGGVNSLRGFDGLIQGERVPDKTELLINNANELIFSPSSFYLLVKTELRFLITKNLTGSVFYDGGIVTISGKNFKQPYRHSVGFGIRYNTPLGPVSGYLGFKISPKINESAVVPHLSFGLL